MAETSRVLQSSRGVECSKERVSQDEGDLQGAHAQHSQESNTLPFRAQGQSAAHQGTSVSAAFVMSRGRSPHR